MQKGVSNLVDNIEFYDSEEGILTDKPKQFDQSKYITDFGSEVQKECKVSHYYMFMKQP